MSNQVLEDLLKDCVSYSQLQETVSQAVQDFDDATIVALEAEGRELLNRIEPRISQVLRTGADPSSRELFSTAVVQSIAKCMEKSQGQVSKNQDALRQWKNELGIKLEQHSSRVGQENGLDIQAVKGAVSAAGTKLSPSTSSSRGVASRHPIWDSLSQQTQVGQTLDHLS